MTTLIEMAKQVTIPLLVSIVMCVGNLVYTSGIQQTVLEQNTKVTAQLSKAVTDLRLQMAIFGEKYVTREELERKLEKRSN